MSVRTQSATADAMGQRRIAAGFTATRRLSGSTTASSRTRSSPPQPPAPLMSGMLGAIAIASVSASRQAEGGGGDGAACSTGFSVSGGAGFSAAGFSGSGLLDFAVGASAGRGFGSGTEAGSAARRGLGLRSPNRSPQGACGQAPDLRAAAAGPVCAPSIRTTAATVTIAAPVRPMLPQGHLRLAFSALKFMAIP